MFMLLKKYFSYIQIKLSNLVRWGLYYKLFGYLLRTKYVTDSLLLLSLSKDNQDDPVKDFCRITGTVSNDETE